MESEKAGGNISTNNYKKADDNKILGQEIDDEIENFVSISGNAIETGFKMYINTLQKFTAFNDGTYIIKNIKKMSATRNFLAIEADITHCQEETFEECQMRSYIAAVEECQCVPAALVASMFNKVSL